LFPLYPLLVLYAAAMLVVGFDDVEVQEKKSLHHDGRKSAK
jgi:hypothetical protein